MEEKASDASPLLVRPKRQHFLPRFYLEGFVKKGLLAVYDRDTGKVRLQTPENTGVIGHLYTMQDEQGRQRFEVEAMLAQVETDAQPVIAKLSANQPINADERSNLAVFVALAMVRTPDLIDSVKSAGASLVKLMAKTAFSNIEHAKDALRNKQRAPKSEEDLEREAKALVDFTHRDEYNVTINHRFAVSSALQLFGAIAPILVARDWVVLHRDSDSRSFLTSDAPVILTAMEPRNTGFYGIGFASPDAMVL